MARIRTIKPEFPHSESMGRVSREARLCFILLWTIADDSGRLRGNSRMLSSLLFPYDDDAPKQIDKWLTQLSDEKCIIRYESDGQSYIQVCNWLNHQKIDKPSKSKIPEFSNPRESSRTFVVGVDQGKDQGVDQGKDHLPPSEVVQTVKPICPPCPIAELIEVYHETLPTLPRMQVRNETRDGYIRARWKQFYEAGDLKDKETGIDCFRWFFTEKVKPSKFLTGQSPSSPGRKPFIANLEWLMKPTNFAKVIEGNYA